MDARLYYLAREDINSNGNPLVAAPPVGPAPSIPTQIVPADQRAEAAEAKAAEMQKHVEKIIEHVSRASTKMANEFINLSEASQSQLNEMLVRTAQFTSALEQSSAFAAKEAEAATKDGYKILSQIQEIHKKSDDAQKLLIEARALNYTVGQLEAILSEMEGARGLGPM